MDDDLVIGPLETLVEIWDRTGMQDGLQKVAAPVCRPHD
jgi:hypothetical protein